MKRRPSGPGGLRLRAALGLLAWALLAAWLLAAGVACEPAVRAKGPEPLQGVVEYDDRVIGFELGGRVLEVSIERGQSVALGAPLARLDDGLERPLRELRVAEIAAAEAQLALLRKGARSEELRAAEADIAALAAQEQTLGRSLERQSRLQAVGASPESVIDSVSAELRTTSERRRALEQRLKALRGGARAEELAAAAAHVDAAKASLHVLDTRLSRYAIAAPAAGHVVDVHVKVGEMVGPGAALATLADLDHPFVDVFVPQARVAGLAVGQGASVRVDGLAAPLRGRIEHVFPRTEFTPRYLFSESERPNLVVRVRVRVDDPKHALHEGLPAFVTLERDA
jgi:HlyD family secretion protein